MQSTITDVTINGSTVFITTTNPAGLVGKYAIALSTVETDGMPGVINAINTAGSAYDTAFTSSQSWMSQLIGQVVNV